MRKLAARVILKLKVMYPLFAAKLDADEELMNLMIDEWSKGLAGITNHDITLALEQVRRSGSDFAPSLPKFIEYCGGRPKIRHAIEHKVDTTDYARLWIDSDDKQKYRFFMDHPFTNVPAYVKNWFIGYNKKYRGWSPHESNMMIKFHVVPEWFDGNADEDGSRKSRLEAMVAEHQEKIINYFKNRRDDGSAQRNY